MKKTIFTPLFLFILSFSSIQAQHQFEFGFKTGYGRQELTLGPNKGQPIIEGNYLKPGGQPMGMSNYIFLGGSKQDIFALAIWGRYRFGKFFLQQELLYSYKKQPLIMVSFSQDLILHEQSLPNYLEGFSSIGLSILNKGKIELHTQIGINPQLLLNQYPTTDSQSPLTQQMYTSFVSSQKRLSMGVIAGIGMDIGRFTIDVRYGQVLKGWTKESLMFQGSKVDLSSEAWQKSFTIGYKFGRGKKIEKPSLLNF